MRLGGGGSLSFFPVFPGHYNGVSSVPADSLKSTDNTEKRSIY